MENKLSVRSKSASIDGTKYKMKNCLWLSNGEKTKNRKRKIKSESKAIIAAASILVTEANFILPFLLCCVCSFLSVQYIFWHRCSLWFYSIKNEHKICGRSAKRKVEKVQIVNLCWKKVSGKWNTKHSLHKWWTMNNICFRIIHTIGSSLVFWILSALVFVYLVFICKFRTDSALYIVHWASLRFNPE